MPQTTSATTSTNAEDSFETPITAFGSSPPTLSRPKKANEPSSKDESAAPPAPRVRPYTSPSKDVLPTNSSLQDSRTSVFVKPQPPAKVKPSQSISGGTASTAVETEDKHDDRAQKKTWCCK